MKDKFFEIDYSDMVNNNTEQGGIYLTKIYTICAYQLQQSETYIDKYGQKFIGIKGDYRILDNNGDIYYMNKHEFKTKYNPIDYRVFKLFKEQKKEV